jgi:hypothetical protein
MLSVEADRFPMPRVHRHATSGCVMHFPHPKGAASPWDFILRRFFGARRLDRPGRFGGELVECAFVEAGGGSNTVVSAGLSSVHPSFFHFLLAFICFAGRCARC